MTKGEISTWREMKVFEQTLITFKDVLKTQTLNSKQIIKTVLKFRNPEVMKEHLQILAYSVFSLCLQKCIYIHI